MILAHEDVGSGSPAVLFIHAFPLDRRMWARQIEALSARAIIPDLPGFGSSPLGPGSIDDWADDLLEVLDARSVDRAVVVGLSMGGYLALALARRHAQRIAGLLLADTKAGADTDEAKKGRNANIARARNEGPVAVFDAMREKVFAPSTDAKVIEQLRSIVAQQSPSAVVNALEMMRDRPDATSALSTISVPTTIVVGTNDQATPPSEAEIMHRAIKDSRLVTIEGAGHFTNVERPDVFNRALRELLERL